MTQFKWLTKKQIVESDNYPFSMGQLCAFLNGRRKNGLSKAVRKIGKCIYIREDLFNSWIDSKEDVL